MSPRDASSATSVRFAIATLDHHLAALGYSGVPDPRPASGGWRRLYLGEGTAAVLSVVGPSDGTWCSIGIELPSRRTLVSGRSEDLLAALAPYEVALDLDASEGKPGPEALVRVALRVFVEGLTSAVVRDVVDNVAEAAAVARRLLGGDATR